MSKKRKTIFIIDYYFYEMENEISILVIEDEVLIAETIRMMLEDFGYHISAVCYDYDTALQAIKGAEFDLVLTDINLGEGIDQRSGFGLMAELNKEKGIPFIFLTAFDDRDTIRKAANLHPSAYLTKPVNASNMYASIQIAVENFKNQHAPAPGGNIACPDFFYVKLGKRVLKIVWGDVYYLEAVKNYVVIKTAEYQAGLVIRSSLSRILEEMMPVAYRSRFVKISRSIAVDSMIIQSYSEQEVQTIFGNFKCSVDSVKSIGLL